VVTKDQAEENGLEKRLLAPFQLALNIDIRVSILREDGLGYSVAQQCIRHFVNVVDFACETKINGIVACCRLVALIATQPPFMHQCNSFGLLHNALLFSQYLCLPSSQHYRTGYDQPTDRFI
jgi:hypothetical protein